MNFKTGSSRILTAMTPSFFFSEAKKKQEAAFKIQAASSISAKILGDKTPSSERTYNQNIAVYKGMSKTARRYQSAMRLDPSRKNEVLPLYFDAKIGAQKAYIQLEFDYVAYRGLLEISRKINAELEDKTLPAGLREKLERQLAEASLSIAFSAGFAYNNDRSCYFNIFDDLGPAIATAKELFNKFGDKAGLEKLAKAEEITDPIFEGPACD